MRFGVHVHVEKEFFLVAFSQITNNLDVLFKVKLSEFNGFRCVYLGRWNGVSANMLTFCFALQ